MTDLSTYIRDEIEFMLGGDWHETLNFFEDDEVTPLVTTGYSMTMQIFSEANGEVYDTLTATHTPAAGQFNFDLTKDEIEAYEFKSASFRQVVDYGDGNVQVIRIGTIKVVDS